MSYKQCPFCGEKNIQRSYGTGVDLMTQDNRPWIGCPSCQYWIRGNDCVRRWNSRYYEKEITHLKGRIEQLEKEKAKLYDRCLENEEAMYDSVINGNDNHLIELVEKGG